LFLIKRHTWVTYLTFITPISADPQIWSKVYNDALTIISTWTNNILGASSSIEDRNLVKSQLRSSYEIKDLGEARLILGMQIDRNPQGNITLSQWAYCKHLLKRFNMDQCSLATTFLIPSLTLLPDDSPAILDKADEMKNILFWEVLGSIMWLQVATQLDLAFSVNKLACFVHNPGKVY